MAVPLVQQVLQGAKLPIGVLVARRGLVRRCDRAFRMARPEPVGLCVARGGPQTGNFPPAVKKHRAGPTTPLGARRGHRRAGRRRGCARRGDGRLGRAWRCARRRADLARGHHPLQPSANVRGGRRPGWRRASRSGRRASPTRRARSAARPEWCGCSTPPPPRRWRSREVCPHRLRPSASYPAAASTRGDRPQGPAGGGRSGGSLGHRDGRGRRETTNSEMTHRLVHAAVRAGGRGCDPPCWPRARWRTATASPRSTAAASGASVAPVGEEPLTDNRHRTLLAHLRPAAAGRWPTSCGSRPSMRPGHARPLDGLQRGAPAVQRARGALRVPAGRRSGSTGVAARVRLSVPSRQPGHRRRRHRGNPSTRCCGARGHCPASPTAPGCPSRGGAFGQVPRTPVGAAARRDRRGSTRTSRCMRSALPLGPERPTR